MRWADNEVGWAVMCIPCDELHCPPGGQTTTDTKQAEDVDDKARHGWICVAENGHICAALAVPGQRADPGVCGTMSVS